MREQDLFEMKARAGKPIAHCLVIDAHGHLGLGAQFPLVDTSLETTVTVMDRMGIDLLAVSSLQALFGDAQRGNRTVQEALQRFPGRFFGYMVVDVGYPDRILPEMERCLQAGFQGVKIHTAGRPEIPYSHNNYRPVFEFANVHHLPVLAHTWGADLDHLEPLIGRYPNVHWLMAHAASQQKEKYIRLAREYPSVYIETCLSACPRGLIEELVSEGLADKVVWGSDMIFMGAAEQLGRVVFAQISPADKEKILGLNARRALRL